MGGNRVWNGNFHSFSILFYFDGFLQSRLGRLARAETHQEILALVTDYNLAENEYFFDRRAQSLEL